MEQNSIQVELGWHQRYPLLAVGAYSEEKGGYVRVIDTSLGGGLGLEDALPIPPHPTAQVSALAWHPIQKTLVVGWENGELYLYDHEKTQCSRIGKNETIVILVWVIEQYHFSSQVLSKKQKST